MNCVLKKAQIYAIKLSVLAQHILEEPGNLLQEKQDQFLTSFKIAE